MIFSVVPFNKILLVSKDPFAVIISLIPLFVSVFIPESTNDERFYWIYWQHVLPLVANVFALPNPDLDKAHSSKSPTDYTILDSWVSHTFILAD